MMALSLLLAAVRLAGPFSDGAVLQRERPVAVWGTAAAGETVTVSFAGQEKAATADTNGCWRVDLDPMPACAEGRVLSAASPTSTASISDVLVGEVWFVSGQSNAVCPFWCTIAPRFRAQKKGGLMAQYIDKPNVRFTDAPGVWKRMNGTNLVKTTPIEGGACKGSFSAMGTFFGLKLEDVLRVPVGLIGEYVNGSKIEPWIPPSGSHWRSYVARWTPYTMRGILWNQGDSNLENAKEYDKLLRQLYDGWCAAFEQAGLSFYLQEQHHGGADCFELQLAQQRFVKSEPHAFLAAGNDMPCLGDCHGNEKETMARRLLVHALRRDYGFANVKDESPTFRRGVVAGDRAVLTFDHAESFCIYNDSASDFSAPFELAGEDGVWRKADVLFEPLKNWSSNGLILGSNLTLRAAGVIHPKRVRYMHAGRGCVYNEVCLPLLAFEEDLAPSGYWCYKPYEYEAWMLKKMRDEVAAGLVHVGYPGTFPDPTNPPAAFYSATPVAGLNCIPGLPDEKPPHAQPRPQRKTNLGYKDGIHDVGHLDIGYVAFKSKDEPKLYVGESLAEVKNDDTNLFEQVTRMEEIAPGEWRSRVPLMLRYIRIPTAGRWGVHFYSESDTQAPAGAFACSDARLVRMWRTAANTLRLCTRTFIVDGLKRDRLPWAGDLVVEILSQAYAYGDPEPVKLTLAALGSGDVKDGPINGIAGYSLWWIVGHDLLQRYFDEPEYLKLHYPRIRERMAEIATHEDERGYYANDLGWDFLDWTDRKGGSLSSEVTRQVIYFAALNAAVRLAKRMEDGASAAAWKTKAEALRAKILAQGMDATRHARALAIVYDLVDGAEAKRYAQEIAADDLPPTVTPYMSTFEVWALAKGGETAAAQRKFESVWGAMTDRGEDCFWEGFDASDKGDEVYEYYGRPYGRSLCHAWSSGPAFLLPGVFFGVQPTSDGWRTYETKPLMPEIASDVRVTVPTKRGLVPVERFPGRTSSTR